LILSHAGDDHVPRVVRELERRGTEHWWFDPGLFPAQARLSSIYRPDTAPRHVLALHGRSADLVDVAAVWYRRPGEPTPDIAEADARRWAGDEAKQFLAGLWESLGCRWVPGPPAMAFRAGRKAYHLGVAQRVGFTVPRTLMTNDSAAVLRFYEECEGRVVIKTLSSPRIRLDGATYLPFAAPVRRRDLRSSRELRHAPAILQEYVPKRVEVRVNLFGDRVLAAEIHSQASRWSLHDWRLLDLTRARHLRHPLPAEVAQRCVRYMTALGLCSGHIDLILTPAGQYVFLEINPHGEWDWLEDLAGLPLTEALVDLLLGGERSSAQPLGPPWTNATPPPR
jgi:glutathione synthase/RimK-type ligase-like ATP-grasp enzyme